MCLARALRLTSRREFESVRLDGQSIRGRWLLLGVRANLELPAFKAGFIVPKALGPAVTRNRLKRQLREIVRRAAPDLTPGIMVVTLARRGSPGSDFAQLEQEWLALARRAGILNPAPAQRS